MAVVRAEPVVHDHGRDHRMLWSVIFGGVLLALASMVTLAALFTAIGFGAYEPQAGDAFSGGWAGALTIVAIAGGVMIGALLATRLAGGATRGDNAIHGLVIWAFSFLLLLYLVTAGVMNLGSTVLANASRAASGGAGNEQVMQRAEQAATQVQQDMPGGQAVQQQGAEAATQTGLWLFITAIVSAGMGLLGGVIGTPKHRHRHVTETHVERTPLADDERRRRGYEPGISPARG